VCFKVSSSKAKENAESRWKETLLFRKEKSFILFYLIISYVVRRVQPLTNQKQNELCLLSEWH
jgi:hypothetical protein